MAGRVNETALEDLGILRWLRRTGQIMVMSEKILPGSKGMTAMSITPELQADLLIRLAQTADTPAITAIYAPYVLKTVISFEYSPPSAEEMGARIRKTMVKFPWLVAEYGGQVIGYAYAGSHSERDAYQWSTDVSAYIHEDWHRKGVGRRLYDALFAVLRAQGYYQVYAGITLPNPGSVGIHQAMGLTPVGIYRQVGYKFGVWHDVGWWQGSLLPLVEAPQPPRIYREFVNTPLWSSMMNADQQQLRLPTVETVSRPQ